MSAAPTETGVGGLFDNIVGAVTSIASGGDPVSAAASLVPAVSLSVSPQATPGSNQTWQRWQQIHPGTPRSDYDNWWSQYGQSGGTINGAGVGDALLDALNMASSRDYTVSRNDSPASIAKKFGVSLDQLLNANPQKATTVVRGVRTWTDLSINEGLNLPKAGVRVGYVAGVGQAAGDVFAESLPNAQNWIKTTLSIFNDVISKSTGTSCPTWVDPGVNLRAAVGCFQIWWNTNLAAPKADKYAGGATITTIGRTALRADGVLDAATVCALIWITESASYGVYFPNKYPYSNYVLTDNPWANCRLSTSDPGTMTNSQPAAAPPVATAPQSQPAAAPSVPAPGYPGPHGEFIYHPPKKLSTGAMVGIGVGVAAVVGVGVYVATRGGK